MNRLKGLSLHTAHCEHSWKMLPNPSEQQLCSQTEAALSSVSYLAGPLKAQFQGCKDLLN